MTSAAAPCTFALAAASEPRYPERAIRFVVTYPPGGGTDLVARQVAQKLSEAWGQQVIVDNRPGGGGVLGTETVANAPPDGYTLLFGTSAGLVTQPLLVGKVSYDPLKAFAGVSLLTVDVQTLYVNGALPVNSLKDLIAYARARPGALSYGSAGLGSPNHMNMELLKHAAGIDLVHVPYQGSAPSVADLLAGRIQVIWSSAAALVQHAKSGKLKALAIGGPQRSGALPDVPPIAEAGLPKFEPNMPWFSIFVPAGTPRATIERINTQVVRTLRDPETANRLASFGYHAHPSTPQELDHHLRREYQRMKTLISAIRLGASGVQ